MTRRSLTAYALLCGAAFSTALACGGAKADPAPTGNPLASTGGAPGNDVAGGATSTNSAGASVDSMSTAGTSASGGVAAGGATVNAPPAVAGAAQGGASSQGGAPSQSAAGPCDAAGLVLCDDFEASSDLDPALWWPRDPNQPGDPAAVVMDRSHSGQNAVHVTGGNPEIMLTHAHSLPELGITDNDVYARVWLSVGTATSEHMGHVDFIEASSAGTGQFPMFGDSGEELRLGASANLLDVNIQPGTNCNGEKTQRSNGLVDMTGGDGFNFAADTWYCLELHYAGDPADGKMDQLDVWVDGAAIPELTVAGFDGACAEDWMPDFAYLKFGAQNFSGTAGEVWYDDIAIGTERIGCGQ